MKLETEGLILRQTEPVDGIERIHFILFVASVSLAREFK